MAVFLAAVAMGLPTLAGGFVGGDDRRLVLNHVLVNHPSITHAVQLFTIVHRDLYQPLPLLTFSGEFALGNLLGLFDAGIEGGQWLFHLTNVLLHAFNTVLVWLTIRMLQQRLGNPSLAVPTVVALFFAVHPFQVETVAWVNGRMMLLSTLFALASILTFSRWLGNPIKDKRPSTASDASSYSRIGFAILTLLFVLFSSLSKIRVGLPVLFGIIPLIGGQRLRTRFWALWLPCALISGWFIWININATASADLFSKGAEHLQGPRTIRVLLALAFYFEHFVWPVGLTSYYPTPPVVHWSDPETISAALVFSLSTAILAVLCCIHRVCRWGTLWFFIAIADTLPFVPARNVLAGDRYMYLPIIGLLWCLASAVCHAYIHWTKGAVSGQSASKRPRWIITSTLILLLPALIGQSWYTAKWYNTDLLKTQRVAYCFPDEPRVWENLGWVYHQDGEYHKAMECAEKELRFEDANVRSRAYQLLGSCQLKLGNGEEALRLLHLACEVDPENDLGTYRLAMAYDDLGRIDEALPYYEAAAKAAPLHNPNLYRLAALYRKLGRTADARAVYEQQLINNPYDAPAALGLVELDVETATQNAYFHAEELLLNLLRDVPDHVPARINLGVVRYALGKVDEAMDAYTEVLHRDPTDGTAALNLAQIVLAGDAGHARSVATSLSRAAAVVPIANAAMAYAALADDRFEEAVSRVAMLCDTGESGVEARRLLLAALERFDQERPNVPWTFGLTAELLLTDGQTQAGAAFLDLFRTRCDTPPCREYARSLEKRLSAKSSNVAEPATESP